jgi:cation-transporting ATPase E
MGEGSRAAKTVAGLVLETNDFRLLPQTLEEGRTILRNLCRAAKLFLVKNVYMVILWVASLTALGLPLPVILPQQVTLLNTLTIGVPALFIMFGKGGTASGRGFLRVVGEFALRSGLVIGAAGIAVLLLAKYAWQIDDARTQRTYLLTALVLLGIDVLLRALADDAHEATFDRRLRWLAAAAVPAYLIALYVPVAAAFYEVAALAVNQWGHVLAVVLPAVVLARLTDRLSTARQHAATNGTPSRPGADS